jgi:hypothetical protein
MLPVATHRHRAMVLGVVLLAAVSAAPAAAQRAVELHVGGGYTVVDVQRASGQSDEVEEEDQGMFQVFGRFFFMPVGRAMLGAEAGYRYLYYYEVPYPPFDYLSRDVATTHVAGLLRLPLARWLAVEGGAGLFFSEDGTSLGVFGAAGFDLPLAQRLSLPIRARIDLLMEDPVVIPFGATIGAAYRF